LISGNRVGILLLTGTTGNSSVDVKGNYIGLNVSGTASIQNPTGIQLRKTSTIDIDNNLISASLNFILASTYSTESISGVTVNNNYLGVDKSGTSLLEPGNTGLNIYASYGTTLSSVTITNNLIGGMLQSGIYVYGTGSSSVAIKSNYIGTNASNASLGNKYGIMFLNPNASGGNANSIGGSTAPDGNFVAHNSSYGIYLASASNIMIRNNTIHTNGSAGISLSGYGATGSVNNTMIENSIYDNDGLGIDFITSLDLPSGVTQNDSGDTDTTLGNAGPNDLQNYPILVNAIYEGTTLQLYGAFNSEVSKYYRLDFYSSNTNDPSSFGEGKNHFHTWLGSTGNEDFSTTPLTISSLSLPSGHKYISATATECTNSGCGTLLSTSEFGHTAFETVMLAKNVMINEDTDQLFIAGEGNEYNADLFAFDMLGGDNLDLFNSFDTQSLYTMSIAGLDEDNVAVVGADSSDQFKIFSLINGYRCAYNISASGYKAVDISVARNSVGSKYVYIVSEDENEELTVIQGPDAGSNYYPKYGEYLSEIHDFGANKRLHSISWDQNLLAGNIMLQLRTGSTSDLSNQEWYGPDGTRGTFFSSPSDGTNGEVIPDVLQGKQYVQYRLLVSSNQQATPAFNSITIRYGD
jgi:parallel beta-helix repeat protein